VRVAGADGSNSSHGVWILDRKRRPLVIDGGHLVGVLSQGLGRLVRVVIECYTRVFPHGDLVAFVGGMAHGMPCLGPIAVVEGVPRAVAAAEVTAEEDAQGWCGGADDSCLELELGPYEEVEGRSGDVF
jgi:hypothetical protein